MSDNSNLERGRVFRKIKSLQFLYEIDRSGRIVRNVKSKKQLQQSKAEDGRYYIDVEIKGAARRLSVQSLVDECWGARKYFFRLKNGSEEKFFRSMKACAEYIAQKYDRTSESVRSRLKKRRRRIYDYDVEYLPCAETEHARSTEQETVHRKVYLTGDLNSWNDSKRSEEHDRVKHDVAY